MKPSTWGDFGLAIRKRAKSIRIRDCVAKPAHPGMPLKPGANLRAGGVKQYVWPVGEFNRETFTHHGTELILARHEALSGKRN